MDQATRCRREVDFSDTSRTAVAPWLTLPPSSAARARGRAACARARRTADLLAAALNYPRGQDRRGSSHVGPVLARCRVDGDNVFTTCVSDADAREKSTRIYEARESPRRRGDARHHMPRNTS